MKQQKITIIAAMAKSNRAIGLDNTLPWHLPEDLKHFKECTLGKPVIMGRHTWLSLGRPLPNRRNLIISRNLFFTAEGGEVFHSLSDALASCLKEPEICIIGGANVYKQALYLATDLYLTEVDIEVDGDAFFPEFCLESWKEVSRESHTSEKDVPYTFIHYQQQI